MARRKSPYPDKPYTPSEDARRRIAALMPTKEKIKLKIVDKWTPKGGWKLWRWDTLEDVKFD